MKSGQFGAWSKAIAAGKVDPRKYSPFVKNDAFEGMPAGLSHSAKRIDATPSRARGPHKSVLTVEQIEKHGLLEAPSARSDPQRNKAESGSWKKEEDIRAWLLENRARSVRRVGTQSEAVPAFPREQLTPDFAIDGLTADRKTLESWRGLHRRRKAGCRQSEHIVFDARRMSYDVTQEPILIRNLRRGLKDYGDRLECVVVIKTHQTYFWRRCAV